MYINFACSFLQLSRLVRSCLYFFLSCLFFHTVVVLYGAPLIEWVAGDAHVLSLYVCMYVCMYYIEMYHKVRNTYIHRTAREDLLLLVGLQWVVYWIIDNNDVISSRLHTFSYLWVYLGNLYAIFELNKQIFIQSLFISCIYWLPKNAVLPLQDVCVTLTVPRAFNSSCVSDPLWRRSPWLCCWPLWPHWGVSVSSAPASRPGYESSVGMGEPKIYLSFSPASCPYVIMFCMLLSNKYMDWSWFFSVSRSRAMSVWDTCLQITVACTVVGAWVGAFPIPLDWDRPWQVSRLWKSSHTLLEGHYFASLIKFFLWAWTVNHWFTLNWSDLITRRYMFVRFHRESNDICTDFLFFPPVIVIRNT